MEKNLRLMAMHIIWNSPFGSNNLGKVGMALGQKG